MELEQLVSIWQLQPHPEGGWYREVHAVPFRYNHRMVSAAS